MRKLAVFAGSFSLGIYLSQYLLPKTWLLPSAFCCLLLGCGALLLPYEWRRRGVVIFAALAMALGYNWLYCRLVEQPMEALIATEKTVTMTLCDYASATDYGAKVTVQMEGLPAKAVYYGGEELLSLQPGQTVKDQVYFQSAAQIRDEDVTTFTSKGVFLLAYSRGAAVIGQGSMTSLRWWPARLGRAVQEKIQTMFLGDSAAFLTAILTGNRSGLSEQADNDISETGLSHIMAVSGMHCGFLLGIVTLLLGKHRHRLIAFFAIPLLVFYAFLTGAAPSVIRACIMLSMLLIAPVFWRESDGPTSLLTALFLILLKNPFAAASISLQLSFAAMAGILWLTPKMYRALRSGRKPCRAFALIAASLSSTAGALVFTTPVSAYYFGTLSLVAPISNLLCLWAASAVFCLGMVTVVLGFLIQPLAMVVSVLPRMLIIYFLKVAHLLARLPYHAIYFTNPYLKYWLVGAYGLFAVAYFGKGKRKYAIAATSSILTLVLTVYLGAARYHGDLETVILDVGQGQSVVLASDDVFALVDCGSANSWYDAGNETADQLLTMGCCNLDALILTHYDSDHVNGTAGLLTRMDVETLYVPVCAGDNEVQNMLIETARAYGTRVCMINEKETLSLGKAELTLFPPVGTVDDDNEQGLSVLTTLGERSILLTGDMKRSTEKRLMETYELPDIDILIAGHHGSKNATSAELLDILTPEIVCISVGANSYGHPDEETLRRFAERNCTVYRTDLHGTIRLSWD